MQKELSVQNRLKKISAVIPAYNEEKRIVDVINKTKKFVDEVLVIDDCSTDNTGAAAKNSGAKVLSNPKNRGYIQSLKRGFKNVSGDIIVT